MSTYTNLKIELLNVGDTGWGPTTNNNFQYALEEAMISSADVAFASADVTLTLTNSNLSQTARNLRLVCTGTTGGATRNLILGSGCQFEKPFIVYNSCADAITIKNTSNSGVSVPSLRTMWVYNNGVDVVDAINYVSTLRIGDLSGSVVGTSATQTLTSKTINYADNTLTGVVGLTATQTLTNKDMTSGTNSFPTTLVTLTGTQTLTNKTLTSPAVNTGTLTNPTVTDYIETVSAIGTVTTTSTLSLSSGTVLTATLTASTACTFTMPTATAGKSFVLLLKQAATTGNGTATFTGVKYSSNGAPTITAAAGKMDILTFVADGTNWYGSFAQGYTP